MDFFKPKAHWKALGEYKMYQVEHIVFLILMVVAIVLICYYFRSTNFRNITQMLVIFTIVWWVLELIKTTLNFLSVAPIVAASEFLPLFLCSLYLFALPLSAFGRGMLKKIGDTCLCTVCLFGGLITCFMPVILTSYPMLTFYAMHSLLFHAFMVFTPIFLLTTGYIKLELKSILYGYVLILPLCIPAVIVNNLVPNSDYMLLYSGFATPLESIAKSLVQPVYIVLMLIIYFAATTIIVLSIIGFDRLLASKNK